MEAYKTLVAQVLREEDGQDMVEYALILGLISIIAVAAVTTTGTSIKDIWGKVNTAVSNAATAVT